MDLFNLETLRPPPDGVGLASPDAVRQLMLSMIASDPVNRLAQQYAFPIFRASA
jgi:hypothetical protein